MNSLSLTGKTALVAGASHGIGLAIARHLKDARADVILASRSMRLLYIAILMAAALAAQRPGPRAPAIPPAAQASDHFDAVAATNAYLATVPADKKQRSGPYFEGGYWLLLWDFLYLAVVSVSLLASRLSSKHPREMLRRVSIHPTPVSV